MGKYVGRLHKLGLVHTYLHRGNWQAVGTPLDLDSVYGKSVNSEDDIPEDKDYVDDITTTIYTLDFLLQSLEDRSSFSEIDFAVLVESTYSKFLEGYFEERDGNIAPNENVGYIQSNTRRDGISSLVNRALSIYKKSFSVEGEIAQ
jgi:hypothetical protein